MSLEKISCVWVARAACTTIVASTLCLFAPAGISAESPAKPADSKTDSGTFSGKVVETINAGTYTYVRVDTGSKSLWAAAPAFQVSTGQTVKVLQGMPMENYHSKTLKRDFDVVYFTGNIEVGGSNPGDAAQRALPAGHPPIGNPALPQGHPAVGNGTPTAAMPDVSGVKKAQGGKTVEEIVTGKSKLSGKAVSVRGKVVRYNSGVMGKNWLHIRDGSGKEGNNDLTVTTATPAKVGDTVLVSGKVSTDRDFGSGYKYAVIIEDATVTVE